MDYTAIGTAVILASRLEQYATADSVCISDTTYQLLGGYFQVVPGLDFVPKGFAEVQRVWQVCGQQPLLKFSVEFVAPDAMVTPHPGVVAIALGPRCGPGLIGRLPRSVGCSNSSGQTGTADMVHRDSATALVYTQPHLVLHHVDQAHLAKVTLVLPRCPDVDALVAAYFVQELLDKGCLPAEAWQLVEYVKRVHTGTLPLTPAVWHTPYGVMLGIRGRNLHYCREHALSQTQQDLYDVQRTFYFLRYLMERLAAGVDIVSAQASGQATLFDEAEPLQPPFERERDFVRRDLEAYDRDVARAYRFDAVLPVLGLEGSVRHSTAIAVEDPTSTLFATWAHEDTRHTSAGFDLVVLCERQHHYRLSVKPTAGLCLQGLSSALGRAEMAKLHLPEAGDMYTMPRLTSAPTSVWDNQGVPDQTLLETTRQGTTLTLAEVLQLVQDVRRWRP